MDTRWIPFTQAYIHYQEKKANRKMAKGGGRSRYRMRRPVVENKHAH